jgi:hypothetical protein
LGVSSIFAAALGLSPFKDVYWTTRVQPNNPYGPKAIEDFVELESVVSILTGINSKLKLFFNLIN